MLKTTLSLSILIVSSAFAQSGFNGPGQYEITNIRSGKVLDLDRNDQTTVIQFSSRGTDNQTWYIQPAPEGAFYIRNGMNGNALTAVRGGNGAPAQGLPFNGDGSQQWVFETGKDGNVLIVSRDGKALDIPDGTSRDGARVQLFDRNGDSNQRFALRPVSRTYGGRYNQPPWMGNQGQGQGTLITCASDDGRRRRCEADMRGGVQMTRQISGTPCIQGQTWGFDDRGIWVDRGCRAEFQIIDRGGRRGGEAGPQIITCSSDDGGRHGCALSTPVAESP